MSKLLDIIALEKSWHKDFQEYQKEAKKIDDDIADICGEIRSYIDTINNIKRDLDANIRILHSFLKDLGNVGDVPDYRTYRPEYIAEYMPKAYCTTVNKNEYANDKSIPKEEFKAGMKTFGADLLYGLSSKYSSSSIKSAFANAKTNEEMEKQAWQNDKGARTDELNKYTLKLKITKMYHDVFSMISDTISNVIIKELPGVKAFLYAQGVKDAIFSGMPPSSSKPAPIERFRNSEAYSRHYKFVMNSYDFYVIFVKYYENAYLTELIKKGTKEIEDTDKKLKEKTALINQNCVFGRNK